MDLNETGQPAGTLRVSIHRGHHGLLPLKDSDAVADDLHHHAVLFPFLQDFGIQRLGARIEPRPKRINCLRDRTIV